MPIRTAALVLASAITLAACATTGGGGPTEVSRYHLGQPVPAGSVVVEQAPGGGASSLEFPLYSDAVAAELSRVGFTPTASGAPSQYVAGVSFVRIARGTVRTPPKFSIGIGGGGGGGYRGGVGVGGGVSTGFGSKTREIYVSELFVQLRRRSDGTVVWEGRAQRPGMSGGSDAQPVETAARLANALFRGFPGESGITTTVQ